jgi:hypothetical protein
MSRISLHSAESGKGEMGLAKVKINLPADPDAGMLEGVRAMANAASSSEMEPVPSVGNRRDAPHLVSGSATLLQ